MNAQLEIELMPGIAPDPNHPLATPEGYQAFRNEFIATVEEPMREHQYRRARSMHESRFRLVD